MKRLFEDDNSRNSLGMDEDSNMSVASNASDSQDATNLNQTSNTQNTEKDGMCVINNHSFKKNKH